MTHILEADGILFEIGARRILGDIYFKCETGKVTGILGRNGQGKTCLMNIVYGSLIPLSKSIRFDNISIVHAFKRPDLLTYLPQFNFIPSSLSLKRVFADFKLEYSKFEDFFPDFKTKYNIKMKNLSGGERRLVEVYVIVKSNSQFSMLDEPFSHIMPLHAEGIIEIIQNEKRTKGFLITDHMYEGVTNISDTLYVLKNGKTHLAKNLTDVENLGYVRL